MVSGLEGCGNGPAIRLRVVKGPAARLRVVEVLAKSVFKQRAVRLRIVKGPAVRLRIVKGPLDLCEVKGPAVRLRIMITPAACRRSSQGPGVRLRGVKRPAGRLRSTRCAWALVMAYQLYRNTTLGNSLQESLDELIQVPAPAPAPAPRGHRALGGDRQP
ncbi:hypothetical protein chiPu_0028728 [Chiloscyllium punctatum]|uniref:Transcription initiation factor IIA gamma subunit N-terminal domain-containing protein n=1 Tax=Chiloscyllium punctatum TaxID=137246 RepID=A0A401TPJ8_CHIPU|nr:hypothetical protein [Chiloscyllium punctatum]